MCLAPARLFASYFIEFNGWAGKLRGYMMYANCLFCSDDPASERRAMNNNVKTKKFLDKQQMNDWQPGTKKSNIFSI